MNRIISIKDIISLCVMKCKYIIIGAIAFALLFGGYKFISLEKAAKNPENSPEVIEAEYKNALEQFSKDKLSIEKQIADKQKSIEKTNDYLNNSILMNIDPYNKVETKIVFSISDVATEALEQPYSQNITPVDYIISKISNQYLVLWEASDTSKVIDSNINSYKAEEKYLRELISISSKGSGMIEISVIGNNEDETDEIAENIFTFFEKNRKVIAQSSYEHSFTRISKTTKTEIDTDLEAKINSTNESLTAMQEELTNLQNSLDTMVEPTPQTLYTRGYILSSTVKFAVIGAVLGIIVFLILFIFINSINCEVLSSYDIEKNSGIEFLGNVSNNAKSSKSLASRISNERTWKSEEEAVQFFAQRTQSKVPEAKSLLLISTIHVSPEKAGLLSSALKDTGYSVKINDDLSHDADAINQINTADSVILMEQIATSKAEQILYAKKMCESLNKPPIGFCLI